MQSVDDRIHKPQVGVADIWDEFRADGAVDVPIPVPKIRVHVQIEQVGRFGTWVLGRPKCKCIPSRLGVPRTHRFVWKPVRILPFA